MLYFKNDKWNLSNEKIRYIQHGEEIEQYVGGEGHQWWTDFEEKWKEHTKIIEFIPIEHTQEQLDRLEEINQFNISDGYSMILGNYVKDGVFPRGANHPLRNIQIQKENIDLSNYILDVDMRLVMMELGL
mgnify:CR=1 FL=1|jgi:hypothetical protein